MHNREMSEGVVVSSAVVESLEARQLLSGVIRYLDYQPLVPNSERVYQAVENGKDRTVEGSIGREPVSIEGVKTTAVCTWSYRGDYPDSGQADYVSTSGGAIRFYAESYGGQFTVFSKPLTLPASMQFGHTYTASSRAAYTTFSTPSTPDMVWNEEGGIAFTVQYRFTVVGYERIRVPAGTFSSVKIVTTKIETLSGKTPSGRVSWEKSTVTTTQWCVKGVGPVAVDTEMVIVRGDEYGVGEPERQLVSHRVLSSYSIPGRGSSESPIVRLWTRVGKSA